MGLIAKAAHLAHRHRHHETVEWGKKLYELFQIRQVLSQPYDVLRLFTNYNLCLFYYFACKLILSHTITQSQRPSQCSL